jgi:hypothetical protein
MSTNAPDGPEQKHPITGFAEDQRAYAPEETAKTRGVDLEAGWAYLRSRGIERILPEGYDLSVAFPNLGDEVYLIDPGPAKPSDFPPVPPRPPGPIDLEAGWAYLRARGVAHLIPPVPDDFDDPLPEDFLITPLPK